MAVALSRRRTTAAFMMTDLRSDTDCELTMGQSVLYMPDGSELGIKTYK